MSVMLQKPWAKKLALLAQPMQWNSFEEMLQHYITIYQNKLEQSTEIADMYRAQGSIAALKTLKYLKEEIQNGDK
jgi:hypothetical protein